MPEYTFTGAFPAVLLGLQNPDGSTVQLNPGDTFVSDAPVDRPDLVPTEPVPDHVPEPVPDLPAGAVTTDPAPEEIHVTPNPEPSE